MRPSSNFDLHGETWFARSRRRTRGSRNRGLGDSPRCDFSFSRWMFTFGQVNSIDRNFPSRRRVSFACSSIFRRNSICRMGHLANLSITTMQTQKSLQSVNLSISLINKLLYKRVMILEIVRFYDLSRDANRSISFSPLAEAKIYCLNLLQRSSM